MAQTESFLLRMPPHTRRWLENTAEARGISKNQLILDSLQRSGTSESQPSLFASDSRPADTGKSMFFTFIDLFAGIGGMRLGLERVGGHCVFTSEWDKYAQKTYTHWFKDKPAGDIYKVSPADIPDFDVLAAGFPCQPFSIAGVSKKKSLGRAHGFDDVKQGNLFFRIMDVVDVKRPPVLLLENVKNLKSHDGGKTWAVIKAEIERRRYSVSHRIIDARHWVPQHRERIFIVCFDRDLFGHHAEFEIPKPEGPDLAIRSILEEHVDPKYTLTRHLWSYLQRYAASHRERGNGFGFGLTDLDGVARTLSARYYKDGSEILIPQEGANPRRLTPREAARLMGFPDDLPIVVSDTQAYKQFGNSVVPDVVEHVARSVVQRLREWLVSQGPVRALPRPKRRKVA